MSGDWTPRVQCFLEDRKAEKLEQKRRMEEERRQISAYYASRRYTRMIHPWRYKRF